MTAIFVITALAIDTAAFIILERRYPYAHPLSIGVALYFMFAVLLLCVALVGGHYVEIALTTETAGG